MYIMKIIKPNKITKCKCGCKYQYELSDIKQKSEYVDAYTTKITYIVECPCCGRPFKVRKEYIYRNRRMPLLRF